MERRVPQGFGRKKKGVRSACLGSTGPHRVTEGLWALWLKQGATALWDLEGSNVVRTTLSTVGIVEIARGVVCRKTPRLCVGEAWLAVGGFLQPLAGSLEAAHEPFLDPLERLGGRGGGVWVEQAIDGQFSAGSGKGGEEQSLQPGVEELTGDGVADHD